MLKTTEQPNSYFVSKLTPIQGVRLEAASKSSPAGGILPQSLAEAAKLLYVNWAWILTSFSIKGDVSSFV
jgi:hypothetical protein